MAKLNRTLGLAECVFFGVGSILGAGIYALIGKVAGLSGNMIWLSFIIAAVCAVFTAFSYAELSASLPKSGGEYIYAKRAFGQGTGSVLGIIISLTGIISAATVSIGFAGYLKALTGIPLLEGSLGIIVLLFLTNVWGIRHSSIVNTLFTLAEAGGLIFVIVTAAPYIGSVDLTIMPTDGFTAIFGASALAFFAYIGFEEIVKLAEETKNPERTIPKALFITSVIVIILYSLVAVCAVSVIPASELAKSHSPLGDIIAKTYGGHGMIIISVIALFSTSNTILSNMLGSSRVLFSMGREIKPLKWLSHVSEKTQTPWVALLFILGVTASLTFIGKIEIIARITTILIFITFIVINLAVIVLRIKEKDLNRPYRIPLNINNIPVISILGVLMTVVLMAFAGYYLFQ